MILPKNEHLKIPIYTCSILGVWPFAFPENSNRRKLYDAYSKFLLYYFILFVSTTVVQLFILIDDVGERVQELVANLCITLLYIMTPMRVLAIRSTTVKNLIKDILSTEEDILQSDDDEVIKIYRAHVTQSQMTNLVFIGNVMLETFCYVINTMYAEDLVKFDAAKNETITVKAQLISSWFPYDTQEHYLITFLLHVVNGTIGACYVMFTDVFFFSLIIYPLGQIRILVHVLSNFSEYVMRVKDQLECAREEASFLTIRECILKHNRIIRYLQDYNDTMKNIMVLDFLQSSLQLASIAVQLLLTEPTIFNIVLYVQFAVCMLLRLGLYYWYANEIMLESIKISSAVYKSGWYNEPHKVKQLMKLVILRANKALGLYIGPFTTMTLNTFLGIIKTTYSYMMVMFRK